jgi:hypothetical protein
LDSDTKCLGLWPTESVHRRLVQSVSPNRGQGGSAAMCLCQCRVVRFRVQREVMTTHPLHPRGCTRFILTRASYVATGRCRSRVRTPWKARRSVRSAAHGPCTGPAVHFTPALFVVIARILVPAVAGDGMARMTPSITLPSAVESRMLPTRAAPPSRVKSHGSWGDDYWQRCRALSI